MNVVFTGRGEVGGEFLTRDVWARRANDLGHNVQDTVSHSTEVLVASRTDTSKARAARSLGVHVISYDQWDQVAARGDVVARVRDMSLANMGQAAHFILSGGQRVVPASRPPVAPPREPPKPRQPTSALAVTGRRRIDLDD